MSRLSKAFPARTLPVPDARNHEGYPAYSPTDEEAVAELLFLGTFGHTYYASGQEWSESTTAAIRKAVIQDPLFVAKASLLARQEGFVRSAPLVALVSLLSEGPRAKILGEKIFSRIIRTGDDLRNFVGLSQSGQFRQGFGGIARRLAAQWLNEELTEYQAIKYAGSGDRLSLRNILRLTHPRPDNPTQNAIFQWLVRGTLDNSVPLPMIEALERLQQGRTDPATAIEEGQLPFEAVMPRVARGDTPVWKALLKHAPYMFLLRSLNAFDRAGVWKDKRLAAMAAARIKDPGRVAKAMQFPFRYYQAAQVLEWTQTSPQLIAAVYDALELSLSNLPDLGAIRLAIAPDVSGSMADTAIAGHTTAADMAGLFTAALWKRYPDAAVLPFGTAVLPTRGVRVRDSLMTIAQTIGRLRGGGTDLSAPIEWLQAKNQALDLFIGLTDSEDWGAGGGWRREGFLAAWSKYRQTVAPTAQAVLIQLVPSGTRVSPASEPSVHYVYGWSDSVLRYVAYVAQGRTMAARIRSTEI